MRANACAAFNETTRLPLPISTPKQPYHCRTRRATEPLDAVPGGRWFQGFSRAPARLASRETALPIAMRAPQALSCLEPFLSAIGMEHPSLTRFEPSRSNRLSSWGLGQQIALGGDRPCPTLSPEYSNLDEDVKRFVTEGGKIVLGGEHSKQSG